MNFYNKLKDAPLHWLVLVFILNVFGLMALYSISQDSVTLSMSSRFVKFFFWFFPAIGTFFFFFAIPKRFIHEYSYIAVVLAFASLFLPYLTGPVAGTYRWVSLSGVSYQPAETMKWLLIIALAILRELYKNI